MFKYMINRTVDSMSGFVVGVAALTVALSYGVLAMPSTGSESAAATAMPVQTVQEDRQHTPTDQAPFYGAYVAPEDVADVFVETGAPLSVEIAALRALVNGGAMGAVNDTGDFIYARVGTVRPWSDGEATGIVAMTYDGPAICVDGESGRCAVGMYLTDSALWGA